MPTKPFYGVPLNTSINQTTEESTNLTSKLVPKMSLGILTTRPTFGFLGPTPDLLSHTIREWGLRICILKGLQKIMFSTSLRTLRTNRSPSFPPCGSIITWATNSQTRCFNSWSWFRKFSTKRARYGSWYTEYSKCVSHLTLTYMLCDSTISNQASPHLLRSLEPFPELWKRARSSLGASMAPPAEKVAGSLQETRSPNAA